MQLWNTKHAITGSIRLAYSEGYLFRRETARKPETVCTLTGATNAMLSPI